MSYAVYLSGKNTVYRRRFCLHAKSKKSRRVVESREVSSKRTKCNKSFEVKVIEFAIDETEDDLIVQVLETTTVMLKMMLKTRKTFMTIANSKAI